MENLINWSEIRDGHIMGYCQFGKVFIRLNRKNEVTGMYTMFESVEKFVPEDENQLDSKMAKEVVTKIVKNKIEKNKLLFKNELV